MPTKDRKKLIVEPGDHRDMVGNMVDVIREGGKSQL